MECERGVENEYPLDMVCETDNEAEGESEMECAKSLGEKGRKAHFLCTVEFFFKRIFLGKYVNSFWPISVNFGQFWRCRGALFKNNVFERFNVFLRTEKITYLSERRVP